MPETVPDSEYKQERQWCYLHGPFFWGFGHCRGIILKVKWNILALVFAVTVREGDKWFVGMIQEYRIEMLHMVRDLTGAYDSFDSVSLKPQALFH